MKKILIVAATEAEIKPLIEHFTDAPPFDVLVTGVGMVATAFAMGNYSDINKYEIVINLGIAGAFDKSIQLGELVEIVTDELTELGAEDGDDFIGIEQLGFGEGRFSASAALSNFANLPELKKLPAITVNTVHGDQSSIDRLLKRKTASIESMEGAAFFYACHQLGLRCMQFRAVSNYVERRNREAWKIGLAIKNLNNFAIGLVNQLT